MSFPKLSSRDVEWHTSNLQCVENASKMITVFQHRNLCSPTSKILPTPTHYLQANGTGMTFISIEKATTSWGRFPWIMLPQQLKTLCCSRGKNHTMSLPGGFEQVPQWHKSLLVFPKKHHDLHRFQSPLSGSWLALCHAQEQDQVSTSFHHFFTAARAVWISQAALQQHLLPVAIGVETQAAKCSESRGNYPWVVPLKYLRPRGGQRFASNCDMLKQTNVMKRWETETIPVRSSHRWIFWTWWRA